MYYIGLDAHSSTCTFCVIDKNGIVIDLITIRTNGQLIVNYIRSLKSKKMLTFEECELSSWLYEILSKEVDEIIVCNPVYNRDYKNKKTDKLDAQRLAQLLRGGFLTPVFHNGSGREKFRDLMSAYTDLVEEAVRIKSRYKSLFRKNGTRIKGARLYSDESFLSDLSIENLNFIGTSMYKTLQQMEENRKSFTKEIMRLSLKFPEIKRLKTIPGIGVIRAAQISAQVIEPGRFVNKYHFYSYCGLVRHNQESGHRSYGSKKIWGNRVLKCVYKMAAHNAIRGNNGLCDYYNLLQKKGVNDKNARNAVSRKIAAISLSLWKNNTNYDDKKILKVTVV